MSLPQRRLCCMKHLGKDPVKEYIRLQVFLSHNGVCSRREAMTIIQQGCVSVNGQPITEPSTLVDPEKDKIAVRGEEIDKKNYDYIILNKPKGYVTTRKDPFAEKTVYDLLPKEFYHLVPVGRLDQDTQGLLLLTNDGQMVHQLTHPRFHVDKTYWLKMKGRLTSAQRIDVERGLFLDERKTAPAKVSDVKILGQYTECTLTIHEGRKRQVRRMMAHLGHHVIDLKRIAQGPLKLESLPEGKFRKLDKQEVERLRKFINEQMSLKILENNFFKRALKK